MEAITVDELIEKLKKFEDKSIITRLEGNIEEEISVTDSVNRYIQSGLTKMDAIKRVAKERKRTKSEIYKEYHGSDI